MRTYTLEIDPEQLVFWTKTELALDPSRLKTEATCRRETRHISRKLENHMGDAEIEDLHEIATIASLQIAPERADDGWSISVLVEDEPGMVVADEEIGEDEVEIDLDTFYDVFLKSGHGTVYVTASVEGPAAQARATRLLGEVLKDRHHQRRP